MNIEELQAALARWDARKRGMLTQEYAVIVEAARLVANLRQIVDEQAEDEGLWFVADYTTEAYLQQELRRLHAAIEGAAALTPGDSEPTRPVSGEPGSVVHALLADTCRFWLGEGPCPKCGLPKFTPPGATKA